MSVYSSIQASVTAKTEPFAAGSYPLGSAESVGLTPSQRKSFLIVTGVLVVGSLGLAALIVYAHNKTNVRGLAGGEFPRALPAK